MRASRRVTIAALAGAALAASATVAAAGGAHPRAASSSRHARATATPIAAEAGARTPLARWLVRADPHDRGLALDWKGGGFTGEAVAVPNTIEAGNYSGRSGLRNYEGSVAWYRTVIGATQPGEYAFRFASANYRATVWLDGHTLGTHRGSYLPFELRARLGSGEHSLVVRIDWRDPGAQAREGFHRTWFNWGGLNGPVEVRRLGASELSAVSLHTRLDPSAAQVTVGVTVRNDGPQRIVSAEGALERTGQRIPLHFPAVALLPGEAASVTATASVPQPALWSPRSPSLYELSLSVPNESSFSAKVGLRELSRRGASLFLNGQRLHLHGATIQQDARGHGDALTPADEDEIVRELRAIGANAARAQHPLDAGLLERLDAAGILVWQGVGPVEGAGVWYATTPGLRANAEAQVRDAVAAEQLHPSVVAWNLLDEVAKNGQSAQEVEYVRSLASWLHARDPGRLVAVDVWGDHPPQLAGALYANVDAVAETDYSGWYDNPRDTAAQLRAEMRGRLATMERTFPGRVLVISEFGAEANGLNPSSQPGGFGYQAKLLAAHIRVYEADPRLAGMLVWLLRDYPLHPLFEGGSIHNKLPQVRLIEGLNQKGLFTYGAQAKPAAAEVGRMFRALGPAG
jgi:Glycosyl hydrolases family 2, TIM barrel domain/Glycosyl hydrolases family 2